MENKKDKKANLEKSKAIFLLIGLIIAIAFVATAFSWQSKKNLQVFNTKQIDVIEVLPTITRNDLVYEETKKIENEDFSKETKQITDEVLITNKVLKSAPDLIVETPTTTEPTILEIPEPEPDTIFIHTPKMPEFPGGTLALRRWIGKHINYPAVSRETDIKGTVYLRFEVTKTGTIGKIELQKGVDKLLDEEAIKVIKNLPKFRPGMNNGKNVNVWFSIPISFKLN